MLITCMDVQGFTAYAVANTKRQGVKMCLAWLYQLFSVPLILLTNAYAACGRRTLNFVERFLFWLGLVRFASEIIQMNCKWTSDHVLLTSVRYFQLEFNGEGWNYGFGLPGRSVPPHVDWDKDCITKQKCPDSKKREMRGRGENFNACQEQRHAYFCILSLWLILCEAGKDSENLTFWNATDRWFDLIMFNNNIFLTIYIYANCCLSLYFLWY